MTEVEFFLSRKDTEPTRFQAAELTINEIEDITTTLRGRIIRGAKASLEDSDTEQIRGETLDSAVRVAGLLNIFDPKNNQVFRAPAGTTLLLAAMLKTRCMGQEWVTPATTPKDIIAIMSDKRNAAEFSFALNKFALWDEQAKRKVEPDPNELGGETPPQSQPVESRS